MNLIDVLALFLIMVTLAMIPSASVALVVGRSAIAGFAGGAAVVAGIVLGDFVFLTGAILGMAALAEMMGGLFMAVRILGGGYLIWMGIRLLRSRPENGMRINSATASSLVAGFMAGLLITLGDIKAILFYASLLPVFIDMNSLRAYDIAMIYLVTLVTVSGVKLIYAYAAQTLVMHSGGTAMGRLAQRAAGGLMMGTGIYIVVKT